jgi:hypothetical protein
MERLSKFLVKAIPLSGEERDEYVKANKLPFDAFGKIGQFRDEDEFTPDEKDFIMEEFEKYIKITTE